MKAKIIQIIDFTQVVNKTICFLSYKNLTGIIKKINATNWKKLVIYKCKISQNKKEFRSKLNNQKIYNYMDGKILNIELAMKDYNNYI